MPSIILSDSERVKFSGPAVYGCLVHLLLDLRPDTERDIERDWQIAPDHAYGLGLRSVPSWIGNLLASEECLRRFGPAVLSLTPGFFSFTRKHSTCFCLEIFTECHCDESLWRIDLDDRLAARGIICPVKKGGMIVGLKVFRNTRDRHPFNLVTRGSYERSVAA